ncbi:glycosyltransferase 87 family protein [Nocardioides euryhalodurans]|uniref:DUF2029 domain-containing protein n=1 Tax=Nocardioides euryhalodurans TaxID=2518370 RepID=A0A4P7GPE8_9ACTN|nr:glycosyltransferase family 39 protein [Nocardioides euryhalodurans]QBR93661.1 DUF2029 domain-containing protein [Nocardioides euryhalodurans]
MPETLNRLRRIDPWGPALAAASVVVFLVHGFGGILTRDLALYAYGGQQFAEGVPPFVSVLNRAGPLAHMVPGVATWVGRLLGADSGSDDLFVMRLLMMVLSVAAVWVVYLLSRDAFGSRLAGVAAASSLLAFQGFVTYATGGPREKTTMMLLVAIALWAVVHRRWGLAGTTVALATLTWQPVFFGGAAAAAVAILLLRARRAQLTALVRFAVGGLLTTAAFVLYYVLVDALEEFLDAFYFINATYTRQTGLLAYFADEPSEIFDGFGWSLWLILLGLAAMVVLGAVRVRRLDRDDPHTVAVVALGGGTLASVLWSCYVFNGWADAMFMLPFAAAGLGGLVHLVARLVPARAGTVVVAAYVAIVLVAATLSSWQTRDERLWAMRDVNEDVLEVVGPDATVMSVGAPQPLVFGRMRNIVYHQMFIAGLYEYVDDTWPGGLEGLAADIEDERPTLITIDHPTWYDFIDPVVERHYEELGTTYLMTWYVDRSLGEAELEELREIVGRDLPDD